MRVLHVIPDLATDYGGPARTLGGMARALARAGCEVDVITTFSRSTEVTADALDHDDTVRVLRFRRRPVLHWTFSWPLTRWVFRHISDYDIVHVHALFNYPALVSGIAARRRAVPYILRPLGTLDPWALRFRRWKKAPYFKVVGSRNVRSAAAVHVTSLSEESAVASLGLPLRIETIPLGVDGFEPTRRRRRSDEDSTLTILYLGRLHPIKGLETLIDAIGKIDTPIEYRVLLAGDGDKRFVNALRGAVELRGLSERVSFTGWVSGSSKTELLESADILVLPSHSENFGVAVAEAMAAGIPVLVSDRVGLAQAVERTGAGIVVPVDSVKLARALTELLGDSEKRQRMGAAGRAYAASELSWPEIARRLIDLYQSVIR